MVDFNGRIRSRYYPDIFNHNNPCFCPITAVCYHNEGGTYSVGDVLKASKALDLDTSLAFLIIKGADDKLCDEAISIRNDLYECVMLNV